MEQNDYTFLYFQNNFKKCHIFRDIQFDVNQFCDFFYKTRPLTGPISSFKTATALLFFQLTREFNVHSHTFYRIKNKSLFIEIFEIYYTDI